MKIRYTCSDVILFMARDTVSLSIVSPDDRCSEETWTRVKRIFARRHHTKPDFVSITAVETIED